MSLQEGIELNLIDARWVAGYVLELSFSDGLARKVDFEPFLAAAMQPDLQKYLDIGQFKAFSISFGNLIWNDYDMCFSVEDLYSGLANVFGPSQSMVAENEPGYQIKRKGNN